mmetsp:Transcript_26931/g.76775  ORF Transcript_26931/g.76775 Transcript_26931/m.76775 type:complete len:211 (-) Transcript_26931:203-835(-)
MSSSLSAASPDVGSLARVRSTLHCPSPAKPLPRIMLRTPMSSSLRSSVALGIASAVCSCVMIASFFTTFSRRFISLALSMSMTSSALSRSSSSTSALMLKTVAAICRTVASMLSRGRTASSVTVLDSARPLKTMMDNMNITLLMPMNASRVAGSCMLKPIMKVSVWTCSAEAIRDGPSICGCHEARSSLSPSLHRNKSPSTNPRHAKYGP